MNIEDDEIRNNNKGEGFDFVAMEGQMYAVIIPVYTNGSVIVKDQNEKLLGNKTISVLHNGTVNEYMTDADGKILLNGLRVGSDITFSDIQNPAIIKNKKIENDEKMVMPVYLTEKEKKKLSRSARL
jgi:hypothetical protein